MDCIKQNVSVCPKQAGFFYYYFFGFLQLKSKGKCGLGFSLIWEEVHKLSRKNYITEKLPSLLSLFKLYYRFCVYERRLKIKAKGVLKPPIPQEKRNYNPLKIKPLVIFLSKLVEMGSQLFSVWPWGSCGWQKLSDNGPRRPETRASLVSASGCCCLSGCSLPCSAVPASRCFPVRSDNQFHATIMA